MPHPHDALIQAHLDGELTPAQTREIDLHLAACESCRVAADELAQLGMGLSELALELDSTAPAEWRMATSMPPALTTAVQRAERRRWEHPRQERPRAAPWPLRATCAPELSVAGRLSPWKWAAAALLTVTGAASAAMVGAPLLRGSRHAPAVPVATAPVAAAMAIRPAGAIAIAPAHDEMTITLSDALAGSRLFVTVTDQAEVAVSVRTDSTSADPARFRTGDATITVTLPRAVSMVDVVFPAALRSARVVMGGGKGERVVATVVDGRVVPADATAEGIPLVPLVPSP